MTSKDYVTMLLDPPWGEIGGGKIKRGADRHYPVVKTKDMPRLIMQSGKWNPDPEGCSVWMWATSNHLPDALWLIDALGAAYVTSFVWAKTQDRPIELVVGRGRNGLAVELSRTLGLGQRSRQEHELLLYARIGRVPVPAAKDRRRSVIYAPRGEHSAKPDEQYAVIEAHDPAGERVEFFARRPQPGWDHWGNELM